MNLIIILLLVGLNSVDALLPTPDTNGIIALSSSSIDDAIRYHRFLLLDIYAPWCKPCMEFISEYNQIARILYSIPKNTIRLASYDVTLDRNFENDFKGRFKIESFPTIIFFIDSIPFTFDGNRNIESIISWIQQLMDAPSPTELKNIEEINDFISDHDLSTLYFGSGNIFTDKNFWTFYQVAKKSEEGVFGYTLNDNLIKKANANPNTLLVQNNLKATNQIRKKFSQAFTKENIQRFIMQQTLSDIPSIQKKSENFFWNGGKTPLIILFLSFDENSQNAEKAFTQVQQQFGSIYQFAISKISDELFFKTLEKLGGNEMEFPQLFIVIPQTMAKFNYEGKEFTASKMKDFLFEYRQGKINRFSKSEPLPQPYIASVKKVVGLNWDDEVSNNQKDVLLEIYTDWCKPCKEFKPQYDLLGFQLRNNTNVVVSRINGGLNDVPYNVREYPTFLFYRGDQKSKKPIEYKSDRNITHLQQFIKNETSFEWVELQL